MKEYRNFIFDIDDTILASEAISTDSLKLALKEALNREYPDEVLEKHFGIPSPVFYEMLNLTEDEIEKLDIAWLKYFKEYSLTAKPYDDIIEVIQYLKDNNYNVGVVTSRSIPELADLGEFKIEELFEHVITCDVVEKPKPSGESIIKIMNDMNLEANESIYIGDTHYDSLSAKDAGIDFGLALWGTNNPNIEATIKLETPKDILKLIKKDA